MSFLSAAGAFRAAERPEFVAMAVDHRSMWARCGIVPVRFSHDAGR